MRKEDSPDTEQTHCRVLGKPAGNPAIVNAVNSKKLPVTGSRAPRPVVSTTPQLWHARLGHPGAEQSRHLQKLPGVEITPIPMLECEPRRPWAVVAFDLFYFSDGLNESTHAKDVMLKNIPKLVAAITARKLQDWTEDLEDAFLAAPRSSIALRLRLKRPLLSWPSIKIKMPPITRRAAHVTLATTGPESDQPDMQGRVQELSDSESVLSEFSKTPGENQAENDSLTTKVTHMIQRLMTQSGFEEQLWPLAMKMAIYLLNGLPTVRAVDAFDDQPDQPNPDQAIEPRADQQADQRAEGQFVRKDNKKARQPLERRNRWLKNNDPAWSGLPESRVHRDLRHVKAFGYGFITDHKARIVVRGDLQPPSQLTVSACTLASRTFRLLMAIAAYFDLEASQYDFVNAFYNADLDEEVFCKLPDGFTRLGKY
ncbi:hypothetical protein XA68_16122 [Ophiocordyceps unilateralis]|uniref:Reverse transcriptase Ty1/copia-type domain-containing protein n=1 Tax=Ophiocordyceps unilateralis TaxID=268505 RepID=A0A2A9P5U3_OPHUN|nr:hypothetical protein XA68_16122 [Ophiocordyceps unilateralis]